MPDTVCLQVSKKDDVYAWIIYKNTVSNLLASGMAKTQLEAWLRASNAIAGIAQTYAPTEREVMEQRHRQRVEQIEKKWKRY